jgi:ClpP class serine protease
VDAVAQGRIFTARQALANGLIDQVGGLREAVNLAKKKAKIDACGYITLPRPKTLADLLGGGASTLGPALPAVDLAVLRHWAARSRAVAYLLNLTDLMQQEVVVTALPYFLSVRP